MTDDHDTISMPREALERLLEDAAERGSDRSLERLGLHDEDAGDDIRELRGLLAAWTAARRTVWRTLVQWVTVAILVLITVGLTVKFGWPPTKPGG